MEKNLNFDCSLENSANVKLLQENHSKLKETHLRNLLLDDKRNEKFLISHENMILDYTHQKFDLETVEILEKLAAERCVHEKFVKMFNGDKINVTENRSVLHSALRRSESDNVSVDGENIMPKIHEVLANINKFSSDVRTNICPIDFKRIVNSIDFEETLVIIISKTFTTAETILNAKTCKDWIINSYTKSYPNLTQDDLKKVVSSHLCAVSTNIPATSQFGIEPENVFGFWDWVGGRYSVWSAVGGLPLSLVFGFDVFADFLKGGRSVDNHLLNTKDIKSNLPIMLGLIGFYNTYIADISTRAILPYCQALSKFPSHVQQLDMESSGKSVSLNNQFLNKPCGPIVFGEPGTNGQHSFYQLIHQGRPVSCEFIGYAKSQSEVHLKGEVSNHEELMSNFFAQPDALANGKFPEELTGVPENLKTHKTFVGDKSSISLLFNELDAYTCGQLLALYEHRVATEGFLYNINSFDQWGVELGKVCASTIRKFFTKSPSSNNSDELAKELKVNSVTTRLLKHFLELREQK